MESAKVTSSDAPRENQGARWRKPVAVATWIAFFALFFLYVAYRIDPSLIYHRYVARFFLNDWHLVSPDVHVADFQGLPLAMMDVSSAEALGRPGGLLALLSAYAADYYFISWLGALALTGSAALVCLATVALIKGRGGLGDHPVALIPAVPLLLLCNQFENPLHFSLGLLVALAGAAVYVRLSGIGLGKRLAAFVALSVGVYYLAPGPYFLFAVICGLFELFHRRRLWIGAGELLCAFAVPYVGSVLFPSSPDAGFWARALPMFADVDGRFRWFVGSRWARAPIAGGLTLFCVLLVVRWLPRRESRGRRGRQASRNPEAASRGEGWMRAGQVGALFVGLVVLLHWFFSTTYQYSLKLDCYAEHNQWERVLRTAREFPGGWYMDFLKHDVIRALYETDRLGDRMFAYPQTIAGLVVSSQSVKREDLSKLARTFFETGRVNDAELKALNSLELLGERPLLLRLLARINVVKGRPEAACAFLGALARYRNYTDWAEEFRRRLKADPLQASNGEIQRVRDLMLTEDRPLGRQEDIAERWLEPLRANPHNRMAFEYLMAYYLLTGNLVGFVGNLDRLEVLGYRQMPRHYQEAILVYKGMGGKEVDLKSLGFEVGLETRQRFREFNAARARIHTALPGDRIQAAQRLAREHGDTYFYYYVDQVLPKLRSAQ